MKPLLISVFALWTTAALAAVVQPVGAASQVLVAAAGSTAGANNTFFRSDIAIINFTTHDQNVKLQWLPQSLPNARTMTATLLVLAKSGIRSTDFVHDYIGVSGLGAILFTGVTGTGALDTTASLFVASRIWTPQPATGGTTSQSFPAIPASTINTPAAALFAVGGGDNPDNYRVNVGVVNLDPTNTQEFTVSLALQIFPPVSVSFTLPPLTMNQVGLGSGLSGLTQINIQNTTPAATRSNLWTAYGSTVENTTGDAWSDIAVVGTSP
jgi:hypothetical protein